MADTILDASVILAFLQGEAGAKRVADCLSRGAVSTVNLAEVATRLIDRGMPEVEVRQVLDSLRLEIVPFDGDLAYAAAFLRDGTKPFGLSLGDRACLALAAREKIVALTADTAWGKLSSGAEVELIR